MSFFDIFTLNKMNFSRNFFRAGFSQSRSFSHIYTVGGPLLIAMTMKKQAVCKFLEFPETATIIKGNYENKIRRGSPIEKIFEVFASKKTDDALLMTYYDLLRAVCPFNFSTKDITEMKKWLDENPPKSLEELIDFDKSGDISVVEYYIFWILHESNELINLVNIPDLKQHFNADNQEERTISKKDFKEFLKIKGQKAKIPLTATFLPDGRIAKVDVNEIEKVYSSFLNNYFGDNEQVSLKHLIELKKRLRNDVYEFEFNTFNLEEGLMKAEDFALSIISYAEPRKITRYLASIEKMKSKGTVSLKDYIAFKEFIIDDLEEFGKKIESYGMFGKKKYYKIMNQLCEDNEYKLTKTQMDILFETLDLDDNGKVDHDEYISLLKNARKLGRSIEDNSVQYSLAPIKDLKKLGLIWADKLQRIWDIVLEDNF